MKPVKIALIWLFVCSFFIVAGCGSDSEEQTVDGDADTEQAEEESTVDVGVRLSDGEVRLGKVMDAAQLLGGIKPQGKVGDYKMYNSKVAYIIEDMRPSDGYYNEGALIAEADIVRPEGEASCNRFGEIMAGFEMRTFVPKTVEVVNDGSNGEAAVLRFTGDDGYFPFISNLLDGIISFEDLDISLVLEYILEPDADHVEMRFIVTNESNRYLEMEFVMMAFTMGDGLENFFPSNGFDAGMVSGKFPAFVALADDVGYGFKPGRGVMSFLLTYEGIVIPTYEKEMIAPGTSIDVITHFFVTDGSYEAMRQGFEVLDGETPETFTLSGTVKDEESGEAIANARVQVLDNSVDKEEENYFTNMLTDENGVYSMKLPAGDYSVLATADHNRFSTTETVALSGDATHDITVEGLARVTVTITDDTGATLPAKINFVPVDGVRRVDSRFYKYPYRGSVERVLFSTGGPEELYIRPGTYTVHASRGFEYSWEQTEVTLDAGSMTNLDFSLVREVDTTGYLAGDFHLHGMASPDSHNDYDTKARAYAAEGVEVPINTDHDFILDISNYITEAGLEAWVADIVGTEVTTYVYGHFNVFPLYDLMDPTAINNGAIDWYDKPGSLLVDEMMGDGATTRIVQINHPRIASIGGWFSSIKLDSENGVIGNQQHWSPNFNAIEIINGSQFSVAENETLPDWYSFLNRGYVVTGSSGTDSHDPYIEPVGKVRNYVQVTNDDPAALDRDEFIENVVAQKMIVTSGPFMTVEMTDDGGATAGMGDMLSAPGTVHLHLQVQAASWVPVHTIHIMANGEEIQQFDISAEEGVVRFDQTIDLTPERDTWYVVVVRGNGDMFPVLNKPTVLSFTNPIYVDFDEDGVITPLLPDFVLEGELP